MVAGPRNQTKRRVSDYVANPFVRAERAAPERPADVNHAARHVPRVEEVTDLRVRGVGQRLHVEVSITVPGGLSVVEGHEIAKEVRLQLLHHLPHLGRVTVHVDPYGQGGEQHHRIGEHAHGGLPAHSHE